MSQTISAQHAEGNNFFRSKKYFDACKCYQLAIEEIPPENKVVLSTIYTNLSAAQLQIEKYAESIESATKAIELNPQNVKAYYRRGQALGCTLDWKDSYNDFLSAAKIQPKEKFWRDQMEFAKKQLLMKGYREAMSNDDDNLVITVPEDEPTQQVQLPEFTLDYVRQLMTDLFNNKLPPTRVVTHMISLMKDMNQQMANIVDLTQPGHIRIVGDTHGQYQDLLNIFKQFGEPSTDNPYLFNGDYVDRGSMGVEILLTLFAWKLYNPKCVYMNRGNHETMTMNSLYGFSRECTSKYNSNIYKQFSDFFNYLPLGHIINGKTLVIHGGLFRDQSITIKDINGMDRFSQPPETGPLNDILWSDPMEENGFAPSPRGVTSTFGPDVTEQFLQKNNLDLLIRSHQVQENGYGVMHNGKCITIFSAPNYIGQMDNKGAVVLMEYNEDLSLKDYKFQQFEAQPIPENYRPMKYANIPAFY
ncbi:serine/threonine-protein phosphatase 5 [Histomonas meleagridis]|uniref:serine/threonine-protein phosphatase 5 n=1 Tax=Histomonas meleagridis TaxID=135588 RepID=UPI00355A6B40|nr:serine/threonine-protein phosphatase 5 [Histomonas meleagridis]KAH0797842.1 serine/threonine-protein phosphatase 5 [Histomonas meleagridis]